MSRAHLAGDGKYVVLGRLCMQMELKYTLEYIYVRETLTRHSLTFLSLSLFLTPVADVPLLASPSSKLLSSRWPFSGNAYGTMAGLVAT